jgi:hypothetical protein
MQVGEFREDTMVGTVVSLLSAFPVCVVYHAGDDYLPGAT